MEKEGNIITNWIKDHKYYALATSVSLITIVGVVCFTLGKNNGSNAAFDELHDALKAIADTHPDIQLSKLFYEKDGVSVLVLSNEEGGY